MGACWLIHVDLVMSYSLEGEVGQSSNAVTCDIVRKLAQSTKELREA
jgi:hypothetical protein